MKMAGCEFVIKFGLRPCLVDGRRAMWHKWDHREEIVPPSLMVGGHGGGSVYATFALVEYEDGTVAEVLPHKVRFLDTEDKLRFVHELPTTDAVDVVRCKDCKHRGTSYDCPFRWLIFTEAEGYHYEDVTTDDGYCSFGERKEVSHGVDGEKRADPSV